MVETEDFMSIEKVYAYDGPQFECYVCGFVGFCPGEHTFCPFLPPFNCVQPEL